MNTVKAAPIVNWQEHLLDAHARFQQKTLLIGM